VEVLTNIRVVNFKSFREETNIDLKATNYKMLSNQNVSRGILKGLMFVGGNATGKTNGIKAVQYLLDMLFSTKQFEYVPLACLFSESNDVILEYTFDFSGNEIVYTIEITLEKEIVKETLVLNHNQVFFRLGLSAESKITEKRVYNEEDIDKENLFLKTIYFNTKFKGHPILAEWFKFLMNSIYFNAVTKTARPYDINNNVHIKNYLEESGVEDINAFFRFFHFNQQISFEKERTVSEYARMVNEKEKEVFVQHFSADIWFPLGIESLGNQTLINMLPSILQVIKKPGILLLDEFSSAFHNMLEELIVRYFMHESTQSQVLFVSHSTNLLKTTLLRPDQIYTFEFADKGGTKVKRVSSEGPRESQNLEKMYLSGVFDGLPIYKNDEV
jgi:AAA15 family ATPase/GTPase